MKRVAGFLIAGCWASVAGAAEWTSYMDMTNNYLLGSGDNHKLIVVTDQGFHDCGGARAVSFKLNDVGEQAFESYTSAFLTAWVADKKVSVQIDGCTGARARGTGFRIKK